MALYPTGTLLQWLTIALSFQVIHSFTIVILISFTINRNYSHNLRFTWFASPPGLVPLIITIDCEALAEQGDNALVSIHQSICLSVCPNSPVKWPLPVSGYCLCVCNHGPVWGHSCGRGWSTFNFHHTEAKGSLTILGKQQELSAIFISPNKSTHQPIDYWLKKSIFLI